VATVVLSVITLAHTKTGLFAAAVVAVAEQ